MQASDCVINYLNKNRFFLPCLQSVILFCTLTSKNAIFICLGEVSFLGYKVGKLRVRATGRNCRQMRRKNIFGTKKIYLAKTSGQKKKSPPKKSAS